MWLGSRGGWGSGCLDGGDRWVGVPKAALQLLIIRSLADPHVGPGVTTSACVAWRTSWPLSGTKDPPTKKHLSLTCIHASRNLCLPQRYPDPSCVPSSV
jgi:hypothetical protein